MRMSAGHLIDALDELLHNDVFIDSCDSAGYGAFRVLIMALTENYEYMNTPEDVVYDTELDQVAVLCPDCGSFVINGKCSDVGDNNCRYTER